MCLGNGCDAYDFRHQGLLKHRSLSTRNPNKACQKAYHYVSEPFHSLQRYSLNRPVVLDFSTDFDLYLVRIVVDGDVEHMVSAGLELELALHHI